MKRLDRTQNLPNLPLLYLALSTNFDIVPFRRQFLNKLKTASSRGAQTESCEPVLQLLGKGAAVARSKVYGGPGRITALLSSRLVLGIKGGKKGVVMEAGYVHHRPRCQLCQRSSTSGHGIMEKQQLWT
jgi:hypothetical protein